LLGYVCIAAGFVALIIDGARSIANSAIQATPLGETLFGLLGERYLLLQPTIERHIHPLLWDPVMLYLTLAPTALVALVLGFLLLWLGARPKPQVGIVTRR
jgi:hypothetical protein